MSSALEQARLLFQSGRLDQARDTLQRFLQRAPNHAEANHSLAVILLHLHQSDRALYFAQRAVVAAPNPEYGITLAALLDRAGQRSRALAAAAGAMHAAQDNPDLLLQLVPLYWGMGELSLALAAAQRAHTLDPTLARGPYSNILLHVGEVEQSIALLRAALAKEPAARDVLASLAMALNYSADADPREVFGVHRRFGETFPLPSDPPPARARDPHRRLRIAFISPDFYSMSVAFFAEPIIRGLDRREFEVYCYSSHPYPDETTERLRSLADAWRDIAGQSESAVLQALRADAPDIVIDLAGLTTGSSLSILAARPAPIQVTAIGYPNTTGLRQIDYRIVDAVTDPPGAADSLATEKLLRLPGCFLCYQPPADAPVPKARPPTTDPIAFGSFNVIHKISPPVIDTWTRLLNSVPGSRLILKSSQFSDAGVRERAAARFSGLDPSRLELLPPIKSKPDHLAAYGRLDIALDPFPYNGTTTTCEALLMGVPVITLRGQVHASRVGASLLTAVGLPDLIAEDLPAYVHIASSLAQDRALLSKLKSSLRAQLLSSPLCNAPDYAGNFGAALRAIWQSWCASSDA